MGHPAEQTLLAYLDRELPSDERSKVRAHVQECAACAGQLGELSAAAQGLADALANLDVPAPMLSAAELEQHLVARALEELDAPAPAVSADDVRGRASGPEQAASRAAVTPLRRHRRSRRPLLAAALVVIFVAGASAAIPGSPVREWLVRTVGLPGRAPSEVTVDEVRPYGGEGLTRPAAISVQPRDGRVRIMITRPAPETTIRVRLLDRGPASVWSVEGRYRTALGEIEVIEAGPGEVVILLPRSIRSAEVELDGSLVATKEGPDFRLLIPAADSSDAEVSFQAGG